MSQGVYILQYESFNRMDNGDICLYANNRLTMVSRV